MQYKKKIFEVKKYFVKQKLKEEISIVIFIFQLRQNYNTNLKLIYIRIHVAEIVAQEEFDLMKEIQEFDNDEV